MVMPVVVKPYDKDALRDALLRLQDDAEIERKAVKARRKDQFTQEDIDLGKRRAERAIREIDWSE